MIIKSFGPQKQAGSIADAMLQKFHPVLRYNTDYDSTKPEETIRGFVSNIKDMIRRYDENKNRVAEIETELNDIGHYIEIASNQKVPDGYRLYRKQADLRRERRACKTENDLLQPVYDYFHATEVLNRLTAVQGECGKIRSAIDIRVYTVRSDVLDGFLNNGEGGKNGKRSDNL